MHATCCTSEMFCIVAVQHASKDSLFYVTHIIWHLIFHGLSAEAERIAEQDAPKIATEFITQVSCATLAAELMLGKLSVSDSMYAGQVSRCQMGTRQHSFW